MPGVNWLRRDREPEEIHIRPGIFGWIENGALVLSWHSRIELARENRERVGQQAQ